jgi:NAD(P)-dependent dehydrogenase (short-subunit alcohol dehydrogenase family)
MPKTFDSAKDIRDLEGKVILVTGGKATPTQDALRHWLMTLNNRIGNSGIGEATVRALAPHNARCIYLCARRPSTGDRVVSSIHEEYPNAKIEVRELDLSSFDSINSFVSKFDQDRLDILFLNAGIGATAPALTKEGYEMQFGGAPNIS